MEKVDAGTRQLIDILSSHDQEGGGRVGDPEPQAHRKIDDNLRAHIVGGASIIFHRRVECLVEIIFYSDTEDLSFLCQRKIYVDGVPINILSVSRALKV